MANPCLQIFDFACACLLFYYMLVVFPKIKVAGPMGHGHVCPGSSLSGAIFASRMAKGWANWTSKRLQREIFASGFLFAVAINLLEGGSGVTCFQGIHQHTLLSCFTSSTSIMRIWLGMLMLVHIVLCWNVIYGISSLQINWFII